MSTAHEQETASLSRTYAIGQRVATHPATNSWARGDRYGNVVKVGHLYVHVHLDASNRVKPFDPRNLERI